MHESAASLQLAPDEYTQSKLSVVNIELQYVVLVAKSVPAAV